VIEIDISEVLDVEARAVAEMRLVPKIMRGIADVAASNERAQHDYKNRTGDLQKSTKGVTDLDGLDQAMVSLEMGEDYASFVVRRGLSEIEAQSRIADRAIEIAFEEQARRISK
jgi:hypothetical protein